MKLRILENSLRFRLSQPEVAQLADGLPVRANAQFPGPACLGYELKIVSDSQLWNAEFENNVVSVSIPSADGHRLTDTDEVTIAAKLPLSDEDSLVVKIEKDFHCLAPREDEDESELYVHPAASSSASTC